MREIVVEGELEGAETTLGGDVRHERHDRQLTGGMIVHDTRGPCGRHGRSSRPDRRARLRSIRPATPAGGDAPADRAAHEPSTGRVGPGRRSMTTDAPNGAPGNGCERTRDRSLSSVAPGSAPSACVATCDVGRLGLEFERTEASERRSHFVDRRVVDRHAGVPRRADIETERFQRRLRPVGRHAADPSRSRR